VFPGPPSTQQNLVEYDEHIHHDQWGARDHAYRADKVDEAAFGAVVVLTWAAEARVGVHGAAAHADAGEEAVFGQDGDGVEQENGDVD